MRSFVTPNDVYAFYYCCKIKKSRLFSISNNAKLSFRTILPALHWFGTPTIQRRV